MVIVGSFILPHGSLIFEPEKIESKDKQIAAGNLYNAMVKCSKKISELNPDIIFLTTPHSISLDENFGIYLNTKASGSAEWDGNYSNYKVEIDIDHKISNELLNQLKKNKCNISGITCFSPSVGTAPLRWAEVVPIWFLKDLIKPKYMLLSQTLRRYKPLEMVDEILSLGRNIKEFLANLTQKVVIIISADLAHTHEKAMHYDFSENAQIFDKSIENWVKTLNIDFLLKDAGSILDESHCCGFTGFLMLQGMLENSKIKSEILSREVVTYFGMMVASFL